MLFYCSPRASKTKKQVTVEMPNGGSESRVCVHFQRANRRLRRWACWTAGRVTLMAANCLRCCSATARPAAAGSCCQGCDAPQMRPPSTCSALHSVVRLSSSQPPAWSYTNGKWCTQRCFVLADRILTLQATSAMSQSHHQCRILAVCAKQCPGGVSYMLLILFEL